MKNALTDFVLARIAEDEAVAEGAIKARPWHEEHGPEDDDGAWVSDGINSEINGEHMTIYDEGGHTAEHAAHIARWDPAHVLAECAAKRRVVEQYDVFFGVDREAPGDPVAMAAAMAAAGAVGYLANIYADHPDFDPRWKWEE